MKIFLILFIPFILITPFAVTAGPVDQGAVGGPSTPVRLPNPLGSGADKTDIPKFLGQIISYAMGIIGSLALVMFIYGGAVWMLSRGNQEQVSKGKNIIIWATLGLAIIFTAYALIRFVILAIGGT